MQFRKFLAGYSGLLFLIALLQFGPAALAAVENSKKNNAPSTQNIKEEKKPRWLLKDFLSLVKNDPTRLVDLGDKLFSDDRLRITAIEPAHAHEWQHRLAMSSALSELFSPEMPSKNSNVFKLRLRARKILAKALAADPSLLVRDGTVESLRRVLKMNSGESKNWKLPLEQAFLNEKNILDGEGFFIRETILNTFREAQITPSRDVILAASKDKNQEVRALIKMQIKQIRASRTKNKK